MKTTYVMIGLVSVLFGASLNAAALCNGFACAAASAGASRDNSCLDPPCWSYLATGSHGLQALSLYAGGVGKLEAVAFNSEFVGRSMCIIQIQQAGCNTSVGDGKWHGPAMDGCLQAVAETVPYVGSPVAAPATANCKAPRADAALPGGSGQSLQMDWTLEDSNEGPDPTLVTR